MKELIVKIDDASSFFMLPTWGEKEMRGYEDRDLFSMHPNLYDLFLCL